MKIFIFSWGYTQSESRGWVGEGAALGAQMYILVNEL